MQRYQENGSTTAYVNQILADSIIALKTNHFSDNYDHEALSADGVDKSGIFHVPEKVHTINWLFENQENIFRARQLLSDERSKDLFTKLIEFRLVGHHCLRIPLGFDLTSPDYTEYRKAERDCSSESQFSKTIGFESIRHYEMEVNNKRLIVDCMGLEYILYRKQYFFNREKISIEPRTGDHIIDAGACTGESTAVFSLVAGNDGRVHAFDPIADHVDILNHNVLQFETQNTEVHAFGISDANYTSPPLRINGYSPGFRADFSKIPTRTIDFLVNSGIVKKVDFIKMDIEGSEAAALLGARQTIAKFKPKLAISLYHKPSDIFEIPLLINHLFPFYDQFYLDHYSIHQWETVLYVDSSNKRNH